MCYLSCATQSAQPVPVETDDPQFPADEHRRMGFRGYQSGRQQRPAGPTQKCLCERSSHCTGHVQHAVTSVRCIETPALASIKMDRIERQAMKAMQPGASHKGSER